MNFAKGRIFTDFAQENTNRKRPVFRLSLLCRPAMQHGGANALLPLPGFWAAAVAFLP